MIYDQEIYDQERDEEWRMYVSRRKSGRPLGHAAPHYPNKSERAALVKIMKASGMSEEEVRAVKENRQVLAKAAKEPMQGNPEHRLKVLRKRFLRNRAASMGLLATDPRVTGALKETFYSSRHGSISNEEMLKVRALGRRHR